MSTRCYLVDIDGTIADCSHRLPHIQKEPKDWNAFFDACGRDRPILHMVDLVRSISADDIEVVFVSGRPERCRQATIDWLKSAFREWDWADPVSFSRDLYMRKDGDHRPDDVVKGELLDALLADGWRPIMAFDDRDRVVKMWRSRGIPCAQVAEGDF